MLNNKNKISKNGFAIVENVFTEIEIDSILNAILERINEIEFFNAKVLIAKRKFLKTFPELNKLIFTNNLISIINLIFGEIILL